jgi:undecaprenyl diphosphate synthase
MASFYPHLKALNWIQKDKGGFMHDLQHLAIIMDGNGRWAQNQGMSRGRGHIAGARNVLEIIRQVSKKKIQTLSLFAFSTENWQRPKSEVNLLMRLLTHSLKKQISFFNQFEINVNIIGDRSNLNADLISAIKDVELKTKRNKKLNLILAINYSGKYDICQAIKKLDSADIPHLTTEKLSSYLLTAEYPMPDLIIRTGDENRISNFFLWQAAYAEIHFQTKYWPDFSATDLDQHICTYNKKQRRFGRISA